MDKKKENNDVLVGLLAVKKLTKNLRERVLLLKQQISILAQGNKSLYQFTRKDQEREGKAKEIGFKTLN